MVAQVTLRHATAPSVMPLCDGPIRCVRSSRGEGRASSYANGARGGALREFGLGAEARGRAFVIGNERLTTVCFCTHRLSVDKGAGDPRVADRADPIG